MPEKRLVRRCTLLFSVLKSVLWLDKNNAGLKPGIEITLLSFAVARPFRLVYGAYQYFGIAMAFFTRGFSFSLTFFFSARFASTFFDGLPVCFSLGARVFGRNSSITRALIGSSI